MFFFCIFTVSRENIITRCEKYSSKLDISCSFIVIFAPMKRCLSLCALLWIFLCAYPQDIQRLMTYNVRNAIGLDGKRDLQRIANVILSVSPDVVAIQEVDSMSPRNYCYLMEELAVRTRMYASFAPAIHLGIGKYGVGVLSRERPLRTRRVSLPGREEKRVMLLVEFEDYIFCSAHLSLTEEDRMRSLDIIRERPKNKRVFCRRRDGSMVVLLQVHTQLHEGNPTLHPLRTRHTGRPRPHRPSHRPRKRRKMEQVTKHILCRV